MTFAINLDPDDDQTRKKVYIHVIDRKVTYVFLHTGTCKHVTEKWGGMD